MDKIHRSWGGPIRLLILASLLVASACSQKPSTTPADTRTGKKVTQPKEVAPSSSTAPLLPMVGAECVECHQEIVESVRKTAKAQTVGRPNELFDAGDQARKEAVVTHGELPLTYRAYVDADGRWWQEETVPGTEYKRRVQASYVIGAKTGVRSFIAEETSQLTLLPLSWSMKTSTWALTEGFERAGQPRFTKAVSTECVNCHTGSGVHGAKLSALACAGCHGDGSAHVTVRRSKTPVARGQDPISAQRSGPRDVEGMCAHCHFEGVVRLRRGLTSGEREAQNLPKTQLEVYVDRASGVPSEAASRSERLALSACATKSGGALTCVTCHSPHTPSHQRATRDACVGCHTPEKKTQGCSDVAGHAPQAECARCHMKNQGAVPEVHQGYTDHRIVRRLPTIATDTETVGKRLVAAFGRSSNEEEAERQRLVATVQLGVEDDYRGTLLIPGTDALSALLDGDTTTHDAWATLGRGYLEIGDREKAIEALGVAIEGPELSLDLFLALAQSYREAGNLAAATRVLVTTLERYPKSGLAWGRLGAMLQLQGNHPEAEDAYAKAVALFPKDSSLLSNRAYNQLESKAVDRAIKLFKRAHDLDPLNHDASIGLADIYISQTRLDDAKVLMVRALRLDKRQTGVHINLGRIAFLEEDYLTAARHFDAAISLAAHDPMLYVERARVAEAAGDLEGARRVIEQGRARINTFEHWDKFLPKEK